MLKFFATGELPKDPSKPPQFLPCFASPVRIYILSL